MKEYTLYVSAVGVASGILIRSLFHLDTLNVLYLLLVGVCAIACLAYISERISKIFFYIILCFVVCTSIGYIRCDTVLKSFSKITDSFSSAIGKRVVFQGIVVRDVEVRDGGEQILVVRTRFEKDSMQETLVRVTTDSPLLFEYGDAVSVSGTVKIPDSFTTDTDRTFLYKEYLLAQSITHTVSFAKVTKKESAHFSIPHTLYEGKKFFMERLMLILPEPHAGFAAGLLLGEKRALGKHLEEVFRTVGIVHIIVLSGYNLSIVAEAIMRILAFVFLPRTRTIIGVVAIILFSVTVGLSATVLRAACMAMLVLVARAMGRTSTALRGLSIAAFCMLLFNPLILLYDPGFQLSFLATLGLIVVTPLIEKYLGWVPSRFQLREYVLSTLATQIFVTPFLLYAMGNVSVVALIANVLVLSVVPLTMLFSLCAGVAGILLGSYALIFGYPAYLLLSYMLFVAESLSKIPFASIEVSPFSVWYMMGTYMGMTLILLWWYGVQRRKMPQGIQNQEASL